MTDPKIGDRVLASMNGVDWYSGIFVEESEILAQYGVLRDDIQEVRFFIVAQVSNCATTTGAAA